MSRFRDAWYVRLPGGQEIKAKSTAAVIHHIQNGTIPKSSRARRGALRVERTGRLKTFAIHECLVM